MLLCGTEHNPHHMSTFPPLTFNWLRCELTGAFCPSQGTVSARRRPGSVSTTMITGARNGPTRAALSAARLKRTSDCTVTPPGSTPQGPSSWWRKAAGWTTSTAMTGGVTERGPSLARAGFAFMFSVSGRRLNSNFCTKWLDSLLHSRHCIIDLGYIQGSTNSDKSATGRADWFLVRRNKKIIMKCHQSSTVCAVSVYFSTLYQCWLKGHRIFVSEFDQRNMLNFILIFDFFNHSLGGISETGARLPWFCLICALKGFLQRSVGIILNTRRIWTQANVLIHTHRGLVSLCTRDGSQSKCPLSFNFGKMSGKNTVLYLLSRPFVSTLQHVLCLSPSKWWVLFVSYGAMSTCANANTA